MYVDKVLIANETGKNSETQESCNNLFEIYPDPKQSKKYSMNDSPNKRSIQNQESSEIKCWREKNNTFNLSNKFSEGELNIKGIINSTIPEVQDEEDEEGERKYRMIFTKTARFTSIAKNKCKL